jgi:hypothetical protein
MICRRDAWFRLEEVVESQPTRARCVQADLGRGDEPGRDGDSFQK